MPKPKTIATVQDSAGHTVDVLQFTNETAFFFKAAMAVDADGSPRAYHPGDYPRDQHIGLDNPAHAGRPGNWWALATDTGKPSGTPLVQRSSHPAPGYWISMTALGSGPEGDPGSYVDAEKIPYFVLPGSLAGARKGDFGVVVNLQTRAACHAIFADTNPDVGEASVACAEALGISKDARHGGTSSRIVGYLVFPKSGNRQPRSRADIDSNAAALLQAWGGIDRLVAALA